MHPSPETLLAGVDDIRSSPAEVGRVELIVRRPAVDEREVLDEATLDPDHGLVGDTWKQRGNRHTPDRSADPDKQLNVMNVRAARLVAGGDDDRRPLAGDQLFVDLDLSEANLPPGTQLAIGTAVIEITAPPHRGCAKFARRFGEDALKWVNSDVGKELNLRGRNARVVVAGTVRPGDEVKKLPR